MTQTILKRTKVKARHILRGEAIGLYGLPEQASTCRKMAGKIHVAIQIDKFDVVEVRDASVFREVAATE
jgi:hypothetical protein